jgi:eukaryotic-like serine/threonine-protein kinase
MHLQAGSRLGPYEILGPIGAGGMGEVYRARDTRLDRVVAIKTLPASLVSHPGVRQRFEREAKAISALNHPNICSLYDVGREEEVDYLVMEHLEGDTLHERIQRGPLPLAEALRYGIEIASALDVAHRRNVIHRDLKPSNIAITRGGAKLLDFGLATISQPAEPLLTGSGSRTVAQQPLTGEGTIVGTYQYMAPEQIEGEQADARTDIFAFGAVLYEMLTGRRAFDGKSRASIIAAILASEPPPLRETQPVAPAALDRVIRICLAKEPDERWQSAHDLRLELEGIRDLPEMLPASAGGPVRVGRSLALAGLAVASLLGAFAAFMLLGGAREQRQPQYFHLVPAAGSRFVPADGPAAASPDGSRLAFRLRTESEDRDRIWVRELSSPEARPLNGTDGGFDPFWSHDGRQVGFFADGRMKRIDANGGPVATILPVGDPRGASWLKDDTILFSPSAREPIMRVPAGGGTPTPVTTLESERGEIGHWRPWALPDGKHFIYLALAANNDLSGLYAGSVDGRVKKRLLDVRVSAVYAPGHLLYYHDGALIAQPFDTKKLEIHGAPLRIADDVAYEFRWASSAHTASLNGLVAWHQRGVAYQAVINAYTRDGREADIVEAFGGNIDLARDDTRLAVMKTSADGADNDIWVIDLVRGVSSRITFGPEVDIGPVWSPDGRHIAFTRFDAGGEVFRTSSSGAGGEEKLLTHPNEGLEVVDWSPDGRYLLAEIFTATGADLGIIDLEAEPRRVEKLVATPFNEHSGRFSPDGKWIAYTSDETGRSEIFAQPFPPDGRKLQISIGGGEAPRWNRSAPELFYLSRDRSVMSVEIALDEGRPGVPQRHANINSVDYVVTSRGDRFFASQVESPIAPPLVVVTDWRPGD